MHLSFNTLLKKLEKENAKFLLAGGYNINLINHESHKGSENFLNQLFSHLCLPSITKPTWFTSISSTLIDTIIYDLKPLLNSIGDVNPLTAKYKFSKLSFDAKIFFPFLIPGAK